MLCPSCSKEIANDARFCPFCGNAVVAAPQTEEPAPQAAEPAPPQLEEAAPPQLEEAAPPQAAGPVPPQATEPAPQAAEPAPPQAAAVSWQPAEPAPPQAAGVSWQPAEPLPPQATPVSWQTTDTGTTQFSSAVQYQAPPFPQGGAEAPKKKKRTALIITLVVVLVAIGIGVGLIAYSCSNSNSIVGTWDTSEYNFSYDFTFYSNGTFSDPDGITGLYTIDGDSLRLDYDDGDIMNFTYKVENNKLTLSGNKTYTFPKK